MRAKNDNAPPCCLRIFEMVQPVDAFAAQVLVGKRAAEDKIIHIAEAGVGYEAARELACALLGNSQATGVHDAINRVPSAAPQDKLQHGVAQLARAVEEPPRRVRSDEPKRVQIQGQ